MLVGNSFGCQIVVDFAQKYPGRLRSAVLVGLTVDPKGRNLPVQIGRWLLNSFREPPSLGPTIVRDYWKAGIVRALKTLRIYINDRVEAKLPKVPVPTLVVRGALDPIVPDRWANEMVRLLPNGSLAVITGVGHTANYSAPLEIARVARIFDQHPNYALSPDGGGASC
jgi:2-hydroxy-6-oxonona-2,4-dienedioate hydrolase